MTVPNMSLFFEAVGQAKRAKGIRQQRNAESLQKTGCPVCPLNKVKTKFPKMQPTLADKTLIYFLAEAPGKDEAEVSGKPLTGPSGKLLRECILDDLVDYCSFDNCVRDRPSSDNRDPTWIEIECCRSLVSKSIEQARPRLIVGLGAFAQQWMLGSSDSKGMRGRLFAVKIGSHPCWFMPTYHPARVMHSASEQNGKGKRLGNAELLRTYLGRTFKLDIEKACKIVNSLEAPIIETEAEIRGKIQTFNGSNFDSLIELLNKAKKSPVKAVDIETNALRPYGKNAVILTCAISFNSTNIAFAIDHQKSKWSPQQRSKILALLKELLVDDTIKVVHNLPFELEWFISYFGKEVVRHEVWQCSQLQAHFLDERRGAGQSDDDNRRATYQSLDFLVKMHFGISFKKKFNIDRKNMGQADLAETLLYNGADTYFDLRLWHRQNQLLRASGLYNAALTAMPRQAAIALAQHLGVPVNQAKVEELQHKLESEIAVLEAEIESLDVVKTYIKDKPSKYNNNEPFNILGDDALIIFRDYLKCSEIQVEDKKKYKKDAKQSKSKVRTEIASINGKNLRWSIDKNVLEKIDHPLANLVIKLRNKTKMKSTYVDGLELGKGDIIWPDNKIHCNFNATFTTTGRLSCVAPWTKVPVAGIGEIPINEIEIGDEVWTHKNRYKKVLKKHIKGVEQMLEIHFDNGSILTCTKNHRVLLNSNEWIAVGELYGLFKILVLKPEEYSTGISSLPQHGIEDDGNNSRRDGNPSKQCILDSEEQYVKRGIKSIKSIEVLSGKNRREESYAGENRGAAPPMDRGMFRSQRVLNNQSQRQKNFCTPLCNDARIEHKENTKRMGSTSHRWRWDQQPSGQPCISYTTWTQDYSLAGTGNRSIKIKEIKPVGSHEVFDITVEEDGSYLAHGIFHHNSDLPNMQNWPHRTDPWIREQIEAPEGHVIVTADYGQLEACAAAMISHDKVFIKYLWEDFDIHMAWAVKIAKRINKDMSDPKAAKAFRSEVKGGFVFASFYGATAGKVASSLGIEEYLAEEFQNELWETFSGYRNWQLRTLKEYRETGYVETPTERRRHHPLTSNALLNSPIQGFASDIVVDAMNQLSYLAATTGRWYLHPLLNIHDDLFQIVPEKKLVSSIKTIYTTMLTPTIIDLIPKEYRVPLSVTVSVGKNWYENDEKRGDNPNGMVEIGKFWSHKI